MSKIMVAVIALAIAFGSAAPAHAAPSSADGNVAKFLADLDATGMFAGDNKLDTLARGLGVCVDLFNGSTVAEEGQGLAVWGSASKVVTLINYAQKDLCPKTITGQQAGRGMTWS